jgi:hypothetical protein
MVIVKPLKKIANMTKKFVFRHRIFALALVVMIIGVSLIVFSRAATPTAFVEPEKGTLSTNAKPIVDGATSGGGYVKFQKAAQTGSTQRFPGDPNPRVTGKAYWGANVYALLADGTKTNDVKARHEVPTGKPFPLFHSYFAWADVDGGAIVSRAKTDHAAGRLPYVTFKANTNWTAVGNGTYDAQLDKLISGLDALGKQFGLRWHEPRTTPMDQHEQVPATERCSRFKSTYACRK